MRRIAELKGSEAEGVLAVMREDEKRTARRVRAGSKLSGLILSGVGIALLIFLWAFIPEMPVYLAGLIPLLVGLAMLVYAFLVAPNE
jgi:cadmium resistance protein CadD (predicted permease)